MADNKVGKKTGKKTIAGKDVYETPEGESVSEKSVTIKFGENAYVNAPSIHDGVQYDEEEIRQMLLDGKIKPTSRHDTLEEALEAAKSRSASLMNEGGLSTDKQMEQMLSPDDMMLDSEPVTPEKLAEAKQDAKEIFFESFPGIGEAAALGRVSKAIEEEDYVGAGIEGAAGLVGVLPVAGDMLGKAIRKTASKYRKADVTTAEGLLDNPDKMLEWQEQNKLPETQRQANPVISKKAADDLFEGNITSKKAREEIQSAIPAPQLYTADNMPEMPTVTEVTGSLGKKAGKFGIIGVKGFDLKPGQKVSSRLDIPAYNNYDTWVVSIHDGTKDAGSVVGFGQAIRLKNITFGSKSKEALDIARGKRTVAKTGQDAPMGKSTIARIFGEYVPEDPYVLQEEARKLLADPESGWVQVGMNPYRGSAFYNKATGKPVFEADEVIQVGPLVLAKNIKEPTITQLKELAVKTRDGQTRMFNEGGMAIEKQMELFEDGGLMQEGGTVDPVSGNDVPVGSTQEEVRDDIPAQLSEGEFVFPADVVRFYGLEKLMEMRQRAKAGLRMMEDMGQMGNSEEATLPDDIPFDLEDLDIEDEDEYNNEMEMQVGGFVQPQGFTGIQTTQPSQFQNYQPQYVPYQAPVVTAAYQPAQQQAVPTFTGQIPQAEEFLKTPQPGEQDLRKYVNDEGQVRMIPFVNDKPIYPIPEGFYPEAEKPVEEQAPTAVTTETARVTDRGGRDVGDTTPGATMAFGGKVNPATGLVEGATQYSVAYPDAIPSMATVLGLVTGSSTLSDLTGNQVSLTNPATNQTITMSKTQYAKMKADPRGNETMQMLSDMEEAAAAQVAKGDTEADINNAISLLGEEYGFPTPKGMTMEEAIAQVAKAERAGNKGKSSGAGKGSGFGDVSPSTTPSGQSVPGDPEGGFAGQGTGVSSAGTGNSSGTSPGIGDAGGSTPGDPAGGFRATGGLIKKPKPKKMKRGGLASKK